MNSRATADGVKSESKHDQATAPSIAMSPSPLTINSSPSPLDIPTPSSVSVSSVSLPYPAPREFESILASLRSPASGSPSPVSALNFSQFLCLTLPTPTASALAASIPNHFRYEKSLPPSFRFPSTLSIKSPSNAIPTPRPSSKSASAAADSCDFPSSSSDSFLRCFCGDAHTLTSKSIDRKRFIECQACGNFQHIACLFVSYSLDSLHYYCDLCLPELPIHQRSAELEFKLEEKSRKRKRENSIKLAKSSKKKQTAAAKTKKNKKSKSRKRQKKAEKSNSANNNAKEQKKNSESSASDSDSTSSDSDSSNSSKPSSGTDSNSDSSSADSDSTRSATVDVDSSFVDDSLFADPAEVKNENSNSTPTNWTRLTVNVAEGGSSDLLSGGSDTMTGNLDGLGMDSHPNSEPRLRMKGGDGVEINFPSGSPTNEALMHLSEEDRAAALSMLSISPKMANSMKNEPLKSAKGGNSITPTSMANRSEFNYSSHAVLFPSSSSNGFSPLVSPSHSHSHSHSSPVLTHFSPSNRLTSQLNSSSGSLNQSLRIPSGPPSPANGIHHPLISSLNSALHTPQKASASLSSVGGLIASLSSLEKRRSAPPSPQHQYSHLHSTLFDSSPISSSPSKFILSGDKQTPGSDSSIKAPTMASTPNS